MYMKPGVGVKSIVVSDKLCKGCYLCVWACPWDVFEISEERNWRGVKKPVAVRLDQCRRCRLCEFYCPDFAIQVIIDDEEERMLKEIEEKYEKPWLPRVEERDRIVKQGVWWLED